MIPIGYLYGMMPHHDLVQLVQPIELHNWKLLLNSVLSGDAIRHRHIVLSKRKEIQIHLKIPNTIRNRNRLLSVQFKRTAFKEYNDHDIRVY